MLDQDNNFYLISMSILISCLLYVYYRERLQVSHFWELKGWLIVFWTVPFVDCYWNRTLLCSHLPHWYKGTSKMSESRNHHNESYGKTGNKKDISFSNNGHTKTYFRLRSESRQHCGAKSGALVRLFLRSSFDLSINLNGSWSYIAWPEG